MKYDIINNCSGVYKIVNSLNKKQYIGSAININTRWKNHKSKKDFQRQQEHDRRKREYAIQNNINLLEIWYWDYDNIEKILKSELLAE